MVAIALAAATFALAPLAYMYLFSGFRAYDDEGYFLVTIRDYLAGHPLFTQALPIYGPFYYEVTGGVFKVLGVAPDNDSGRMVTIAVWLITSLLAGLTAFRLTRNVWIALTALLVAFRVLSALATEPIQPAGLTSLMVIGLAFAATFKPARPALTGALMGALVAALCLVKINVGVFAGIAVAFSSAASLDPRWRRLALPLMVGVITVVPVGLLAGLLNHAWVLEFAVLVSVSAACVGLATVVALPAGLPRPRIAWLLGGAALVSIVCIAIALLGGARPDAMWRALVLLAAGFPTVFTVPLEINPGIDAWALIALAFALALFGPLRRPRVSAGAAGVARIGAGLFTFVTLFLLPASLFLLALPLAWIANVAPRDDPDQPADAYVRVLLPALAVLESLQAYPVAGTQLSLAGLCLVPVAALTMGDGIRQLRRAGWIAPSFLAVNFAAILLLAFATISVYAAGTPLGLPGAERVRLPSTQTAELRALVAAIDQKCSSFISYPTMNSLYLWTDKNSPVELSEEVWFLVLSTGDQETVVRHLQDQPGLCVVKNQDVIDFWTRGRAVPDRPLVQFINDDFQEGGTFGGYVLLIRSNR
jgi:hypothetical protein